MTIVRVAVVVVISSATSALATTWCVVIVDSAVAATWRWKVAWDVFDAVVTSAVDQLSSSWAGSFAAFDVGLLAHVVRLVSLAWSHAHVAVAPRLIVVAAVGAHVVERVPRWQRGGGGVIESRYEVKQMK